MLITKWFQLLMHHTIRFITDMTPLLNTKSYLNLFSAAVIWCWNKNNSRKKKRFISAHRSSRTVHIWMDFKASGTWPTGHNASTSERREWWMHRFTSLSPFIQSSILSYIDFVTNFIMILSTWVCPIEVDCLPDACVPGESRFDQNDN